MPMFLPGPGPLEPSPHAPIDVVVAATITPPAAIVVEREHRRELVLDAVSVNGLYALRADVAPPDPFVVAFPDERRRRPAVDPIVLSGASGVPSNVGVPGTTPPPALSIDRSDQRTRYLPLAPIALSGASQVPSGVGDPGTLPPAPIVIERERRREAPPVATSINGLYSIQSTPAVTPSPVVVPIIDERRRRPGLDPIVLSGANSVDSGVGTPGTTPPPAQNIDRSDQRGRYRPFDPISISGVLASFAGAPPATPPGPFVVPLDDRRRFLAAIAPTSIHGYDDADPPAPTVVGDDRRRPRTPDPLVLSGVRAPFVAPLVMPPGPVVVLGDDGRLRRLRLDPIVLRGTLALFVVPVLKGYALATDAIQFGAAASDASTGGALALDVAGAGASSSDAAGGGASSSDTLIYGATASDS